MIGVARRLAMFSTGAGIFLVLLLYVPALQAPFLVPKFAALEICAVLGFVAFALRRAANGDARWRAPLTAGAHLVLATSVMAWVIAAARPLGAPYALSAVGRWASLFGLACGASTLDPADRSRARLLEAVTIAAAAVAGAGLLQHLGVLPLAIPVISVPGSTFGNRNPAGEAIAMALPLGLGAAAAARQRTGFRLLVAALVLELVYVAATRARGAWLGSACGLAMTLWALRPKWSRALTISIAVSVAMALVAAMLPGRFNPRDAGDKKRYSAVVDVLVGGVDSRSIALKSRVGLWRRTVAMVRDRPLFGVGPGNWPVVFPLYAEPGAADDHVLSASVAPRQVHNDWLERAAEAGMLGLGALVWLVAAAVIETRKSLRESDEESRPVLAGAAGSLVALVAISLLGFPLEMPATIALAGVCLGLLAPCTVVGQRARRHRSLEYATVAAGLALLPIAIVRAERSIRSNLWLGAAERALHRDRGLAGATEAIADLNRALAIERADYRAQLRASQMYLRAGDAPMAVLAARGALDIEPYAPNARTALAAAELATGDTQGARAEATHALALLHQYPFAFFVRAEAADREGDPAAAAADREELTALSSDAADEDTKRAARALMHDSN